MSFRAPNFFRLLFSRFPTDPIIHVVKPQFLTFLTPNFSTTYNFFPILTRFATLIESRRFLILFRLHSQTMPNRSGWELRKAGRQTNLGADLNNKSLKMSKKRSFLTLADYKNRVLSLEHLRNIGDPYTTCF